MRARRFFPRVLATLAAAVLLLAPSPAAARSDKRASALPRATTVMGSAWTMNNQPIPAARVQLRNVVTGKIAGTAVADNAGRFSFTNIETGSYVVELVGTNGKTLTVGHPFVIAAGETVATFVRLAAQTPWYAQAPWYAAFFSNAAAGASSAAASYGITAMAPVQLPLSSR